MDEGSIGMMGLKEKSIPTCHHSDVSASGYGK
jgi:hypothetical protein